MRSPEEDAYFDGVSHWIECVPCGGPSFSTAKLSQLCQEGRRLWNAWTILIEERARLEMKGAGSL